MYNRYIPKAGAYTRVTVEDSPSPAPPPPPSAEDSANPTGVDGLLKRLKLDRLDAGDLLILLILLVLILDGDDTELIITLGLVLLLGLG